MVRTGTGRLAGGVGPLFALVIGLPIVVWGLTASTAPMLPWFIPVCDAVAILCMGVVAVLGCLDASLRQDRRSLPIAGIAVATSLLWIAHFCLFPGVIPGLAGSTSNQATSTIFLSLNILTPLLLAMALLDRGGQLRSVPRGIGLTVGIGAAVGCGVIAAAIVIGDSIQTVSDTGRFSRLDAAVGFVGLVPVAVAVAAFALGRHGDERIAEGVLAALTFTALTSVCLLFLSSRFTPSWYADHVLGSLPFVAILAAELALYGDSVLREREASVAALTAAERRGVGLDIAAAMAVETNPKPVIDRLLSGVLTALKADRATMLRLVPDGYVVESSVDRHGEPASVGRVMPLPSVVAGGKPVVEVAVATREPQLVDDGYRVESLDPPGERHAGVRRGVVMPLVRGGEVDAVIILGRRRDDAFSAGDLDQLRELGAIAALLIRNVRLLAEAEEVSRAKSSFINLAAHELRTPLAVIRGYVDMLADGTFGELPASEQVPVDTIRAKVAELADHIDKLLAASRLEAGLAPVADSESTDCDLAEVIVAAVHRARGRLALVGGEIEVRGLAGPIPVVGAARDVGTVLDNLLNNAITYSAPPARITVEVSAGTEPEVKVVDRGIGIPAGEHQRVFEQFHRVDDPAFGYPSGTGLGLYISRRLAEASGGSLALERSVPGEGSVFTLRLLRRQREAGVSEQGIMREPVG